MQCFKWLWLTRSIYARSQLIKQWIQELEIESGGAQEKGGSTIAIAHPNTVQPHKYQVLTNYMECQQ